MKKLIFVCFLILTLSCSKKVKEYYIGIDPGFYPLGLEYLEKNVYGFIQELLLEIAQDDNIKIFLVKANWDNLFDGLEENKYQAVFSAKQPYIFVQSKYNFSEIVLKTGPALFFSKNRNYSSLKDLQNKLVGYVQGTEDNIFLEKSQVILKDYPSLNEALLDIDNGFLDAAYINSIKGREFLKNIYANKMKMIYLSSDEGIRLVSVKKNDEIIKMFNKNLSKLQKKDRLNKLYKKWNLS